MTDGEFDPADVSIEDSFASMERIGLQVVPNHCDSLTSKCASLELSASCPAREGRVVVGDLVDQEAKVGGDSQRTVGIHPLGKHRLMSGSYSLAEGCEYV